jgi:2-polyprenyl-3-methyl-5-hydroxy-6-metoxy-1,4-benzoquinol methylase
MQDTTLRRLLELNHQFYQSFGDEFSATRARIQPGVSLVIRRLEGHEHILDLGCGNGELARQLARLGHQGSYTGIDFSQPLLASAGQQPDSFPVKFIEADLTGRDWDSALPPEKYDFIFSFATLHHIPSEKLRIQILMKVSRLLKKGGQFIHSHWQFMNSPRLKNRIQPWQAAGLVSEELEPGDHLLDWKRGGHGLRYIHLFNEEELSRLAEATGFRVCETFLSDGQGGRLGLYQMWELLSSI